MRLDVTADRLRLVIIRRVVEHERSNFAAVRGRFVRSLPLASIRESAGVAALRDRLVVRGGAIVGRFETEVQVAAARSCTISLRLPCLRAAMPWRTEQGSIVKRVEQVEEGSVISVAVSDGEPGLPHRRYPQYRLSVEPWKEIV